MLTGKSQVRQVWVRFKEKYPEFERAKQYKVSLGPKVDAFISELIEWDMLIENAKERLPELEKLGIAAKNAAAGYKAMVHEVVRVRPEANEDFGLFYTLVKKGVCMEGEIWHLQQLILEIKKRMGAIHFE